MDLKDFFALLDRRTLGAASVVVAVFAVILLIVAFFTRNTLLDWLINDVYNVSGNIEKRVARDISVGYGRTFIFDEYRSDSLSQEVPQTLLFTLAPTQDAKILLNSNVAKRTGSDDPIPIKVMVDSSPIVFTAGTKLEVPFPENRPLLESMDRNRITSQESYPGHAHALSVILDKHNGKALVTIDALVVVTGPPEQ